LEIVLFVWALKQRWIGFVRCYEVVHTLFIWWTRLWLERIISRQRGWWCCKWWL